jgi:hypothetical protein
LGFWALYNKRVRLNIILQESMLSQSTLGSDLYLIDILKIRKIWKFEENLKFNGIKFRAKSSLNFDPIAYLRCNCGIKLEIFPIFIKSL